jgi:6-phosphogluconolactonase
MKIVRLVSPGSCCLLLFASLFMPLKSLAQADGNHRVKFAYAADQNANAVFAYRFGPHGSLAPLERPSFPAGSVPNGVAVDPSGRFVYVANLLSNDVSGYSINPNGTLTPVPGSPFPAGSGPNWIIVDPTGRFVYVTNCADLCSGSGQGNVSGYAINKSTGALAAMPGSPFTADEIPFAVIVDPTGSFAYVANVRSSTISVFNIDQVSGALSVGTPSVPTGGISPLSLTLDPQGRFLYVANTQSDTVSAFAVGGDGILTPVPGSPFPSADLTQGVAVDSSGEFLYVSAGFQVLGYSIGASGDLTPLPSSPFPAPGFLVSLITDLSGRFLYGAAQFAGVDAFAIDPDTGNLTPVSGSPFAAGGGTAFVTTTVGH